MTIPASMPIRVVYLGDGVTVNFPIPFAYFANADGTKQLSVVVADATGENETVLTENTDFTITAAGQPNGTLTMKAPLGKDKKLTIVYNIPIEQTTDWEEFGRLPSESIETSFDKVVAILKQHQEILDRCVKVVISGNQTPQELLDEVYEKLDSATQIAADAREAANEATTAADNATAAVEQAEGTLASVTEYVDSAKKDIAQTVADAKESIDNTVATAEDSIEETIIAAVTDVKEQAVAAAQEAIDGATVTVTQAAKDNLDAYVDDTVEPSLQAYLDSAQQSADAAAASAAEAKKTATETLNNFNIVAAEKTAIINNMAKEAANSAAAASLSEKAAASAETNVKELKKSVDASAAAAANSASQAAGSAKEAARAALSVNSGWNLFDSKWSDHLINDIKWLRADTFSWQDGTVYSEAYNELAYFKNNLKLEISAGNLIIKAGSTYSYPDGFEADGVTPKFMQITSTQDITYEFVTSSGVYMVTFSNNDSAAWFERKYVYKAKTAPAAAASIQHSVWYDTAENTVKYSNDYGKTWRKDRRAVIALVTLDKGKVTAINQIFNGVNGFDYKEENGIGYCQSDKGHKIASANQESAIASLYNSTGVAWYYILDTANRRFKLPRTKWGFVGLRDTVGGYVAESLPDHSHVAYGSTNYYGTSNNAFGNGSDNPASLSNIISKASATNSVYKEGAPVQQRATQMYLYFYVGQFNQTATEQTAGLKAELFNGKADLNLSNVSSNIDYVVKSYINGSSWYKVYKSGWVEQGGYNFLDAYVGGAFFTQNLLLPMKDKSYTVLLCMCDKGATMHAGNNFFMFSDNYTTTKFSYCARGGDNRNYKTSSIWYVCGQGA